MVSATTDAEESEQTALLNSVDKGETMLGLKVAAKIVTHSRVQLPRLVGQFVY